MMPIHEKLRGRDFPTTRNYLRVTMVNIHEELTRRLDPVAVAQSPAQQIDRGRLSASICPPQWAGYLLSVVAPPYCLYAFAIDKWVCEPREGLAILLNLPLPASVPPTLAAAQSD